MGAFVTFATATPSTSEVARQVFEVADPELVREARDFLEWTTKQKRKAPPWACQMMRSWPADTLKRAWRRAHSKISGLWPALKGYP